MMLHGAEILVRTLMEQGVSVLFGYPGGAVLPIFDALYAHRDQIRVILPAHEQGGTHAADAYARVSGRTGVVVATSGPGATNLVTGIANAYMDSVPLVAITGNVPLHQIGQDSFQEIDICGVTMPITKHNFMVQDVKDLAFTVREAFAIAQSGRPGPVLIDIPKNVAEALCDYIPAGAYVRRPFPKPSELRLRQCADAWDKCERPLILCGGGVVSSDASNALRTLAEKTGVPVAATLMGLGAFPSRHPQMLGMLGMHGSPAAGYAAARCDLLLCAGTRFSDRVAGDKERFAPNARLVHLDIDPSEFDKNLVSDIQIHGDARDILERLAALCPPKACQDWLADIRSYRPPFALPNPAEDDTANHFSPPHILDAVHEAAGENAIIVTDVGQHQMWTAQHYPFSQPRSFITSGGLGAMGFGTGAALGAKAAAPERPVILITGDGSLHMNFAELSAAAGEDLPITAVLLNNGVLGMVRQWQHMFYSGHHASSCPRRRTDYQMLAEALGALPFYADTLPDLRRHLRTALDSGRTALIECPIHADEQVWPMIPPGRSGTHDGI